MSAGEASLALHKPLGLHHKTHLPDVAPDGFCLCSKPSNCPPGVRCCPQPPAAEEIQESLSKNPREDVPVCTHGDRTAPLAQGAVRTRTAVYGKLDRRKSVSSLCRLTSVTLQRSVYGLKKRESRKKHDCGRVFPDST